MPIEPIKLYHITHVDNLGGIIERGGLVANCQIQACSMEYKSIAFNHIQDSRATINVPRGPGGTLHDYVPFYFAPRSPMLYTIHRGNVPNYSDGQRDIIYLVTDVNVVEQNSLEFVFTDGHGIMAMTDFFDDLDRLDEIDWDIMAGKYWYDTDEMPDRKRKRQAEFLIHQHMPWNCFTHIAVINSNIRQRIIELLPENRHIPRLIVKPGWYY